MAIQHANRENALLDFWISLNPNVRIVMVIATAVCLCGFLTFLKHV